ncbi:MAG: hypothetical protein P8M72_10495 [Gammaproteobacteria bacterium]|nr:hypothetical protein [Gammaproteobacteria bacterium]
MRYIFLTALSLLAFSASAAIPENIVSIAGNYSGYAYNGQNLDPVITVMKFEPNGRFTGQYKVEDESGDFEGVLSGLILEEERSFSMEWTDHDGEGFVYMEFSSDYSSFTGFWTNSDGEEQFPWTGRRQ